MNEIIELQIDSSSTKISKDDSIINDFKNIFSGCNINFLIGAGFCADILKILGNKEHIFEAINHSIPTNDDEQKKLNILLAYEYWDFFASSIKAINTVNCHDASFKKFYEFAKNIYQILLDKSNPVLGKKANIFTTNYDPVIELAFDESKAVCNDGFEGRISPLFSTANFSKTYYREAFYSNRKSEIPAINLIKAHGSITWGKDSDDRIIYDDYRRKIETFSNSYLSLFDSSIITYLNSLLISDDEDTLVSDIEGLIKSNYLDSLLINYLSYIDFLEKYHSRFLIVNPTKEKFSDTLLNKNYYEMLRMFSNEMEKENTLLCVIGFSFADEHIQDLLKRSMINPSLKVVIFCYKKDSIKGYKTIFSDNKNNNISYVYLNGSTLSIDKINDLLSYIHI